ncbi:hypothetical protein M427DRAFT_50791 [Gonapodya prolifera JEL478]|uniref:Uncharacterized protein n=1 Tax=Gonapodya prolifera (strain JEL478) TaxID=1344416 RepID=A0A139B0E8_GONPJ|nr:hypothetical protein M427DRAFT_50791 [Gonapodya prolifera JEL478]|eukprot:KXS22472.1 hypothetical protein M427DRAFT_50791 [Gonapodya prolifera JEL478]
MACVVTLPANALSATGLSTPWVVSGNGCTQAADGKPTFAECTIVDTATGKLSVYSPLMINKGQAFVKPVVPALTATSVVGCWFGTNGASTTIADGTNGKDLAAANCVNGDPNTKGDIFGQFAACNAAQFFAAANKATLTIPALGTGKNGKTCYTTRSFEVVDMDQSDNVITTYSLDANGKIGQKTTANSQTLTTDINNGSDNLLLDAFLRPAIGCTAFTVPSLADPAMSFGSLALNELQAAKFQQAPVAQVPPNNPMVVNAAGNPSKTKQNAYRAAVNQAAGAGTTAESTAYCQSFLDVSAASIITDSKFTIGFASPDTGAGSNLYTFLGQRHAASWAGLGCDTLLPNVAYLDPNQKLPIIANTDANGVTTSLTFNTQTLLNLAKANGLATGTTPAPAPTPAAGTPPAAQPTKTAGTPAATPAPAPATAGAPNYDFVWDISACYPSGGAQNIFQLNIKASVNGDQPAADANGGLAALQITFGGLASIGISNTWASANSKATGNVWSFETIDDGPNIGGQFLLPAGVACVGQMPATVPTLSMTGKLLTGGPINAVIRPKGAPAGQGATVPVPAPPPATPAPAPTPAPTPAPAPTPTPAPATGGGLPYVFNYKFDNCWGNTGAVFFPLRMTLSVNGHQPMDDADGGLAAISMTFGGLQNVMISNTWSIGNAMTTGNTLKFETQDDAPNPGGIFQTSDPAVSCQNGKMSVTPTLTASGALLNGGAIAITLNQTA